MLNEFGSYKGNVVLKNQRVLILFDSVAVIATFNFSAPLTV